jgi:hypothetical protein
MANPHAAPPAGKNILCFLVFLPADNTAGDVTCAHDFQTVTDFLNANPTYKIISTGFDPRGSGTPNNPQFHVVVSNF